MQVLPITFALVLAVMPATGLAQAQDQAAFDACLSGLRPAAAAAGINQATFDTYATTVVPDMAVLDLLDAQPEFTTPIWDYLAALVDQQRVDDGQAMLKTHAAIWAQVAQQYGVYAQTVVAV